MRCGTVLNKLLTPYRPPIGELFGAVVAESQLIEATLEATTDVNWDLIQSEHPAFTSGRRDQPMDYNHIYKRFPERVAFVQADALPALALDSPYVLVTSAPTFTRLAEFRVQAGLSSVPICCLVHSLNTWSYNGTYKSILLQAEPHDVIVASSSTARHVLAATFSELNSQLTTRFQLARSLTEPTIVDIPFGVFPPPHDYLVADPRVRESLKIRSDRFVALYLGRLSETYKADLDVLLRAVSAASCECPHVHLLLAGQTDDQNYVQYLRVRAGMLGIADRVTIVENFPDFIKPQLIECSDVVVLPADSIQETFGLAVLESMAFAKPVIAASWSGYRDLITHGVTGFLVSTALSAERLYEVSRVWPLYDAKTVASLIAQGTLLSEAELTRYLITLARDPQQASCMGVSGKQRVLETYTWPNIARRFHALWIEQLALAKPTQLLPAEHAFPYQRIFMEYADTVFDDECGIQLCSKESLHKFWVRGLID